MPYTKMNHSEMQILKEFARTYRYSATSHTYTILTVDEQNLLTKLDEFQTKLASFLERSSGVQAPDVARIAFDPIAMEKLYCSLREKNPLGVASGSAGYDVRNIEIAKTMRKLVGNLNMVKLWKPN